MENEDDVINDACGVFGCVTAGPWPNTVVNVAADVIYPALANLQHRGQESAGIVVGHGDNAQKFEQNRKMGLVTNVFTKEVLMKLNGNLGIGHTRYSTHGSSDKMHCQPFIKEMIHGWFAVAHNGQIVNASKLKKELLHQGIGLSTASDTELIAHVLCQQPTEEGNSLSPNWVARIQQLMSRSSAAYSLVILYKDSLYAVRDPFGNRPLAVGELLSSKQTDEVIGWVVASESCCFHSIGAKFCREVKPGEIIQMTREGLKPVAMVSRPNPISMPAFCIFEYVYFARPDSIFEGQMVYAVRERCGRRLAVEATVEADIVSTVPDSATPAALGYSQQSKLPYAEVLYKNSYIGRTFIKPSLRSKAVDLKFGVVMSNVVGKRIVLIDDSIVRGNTMPPIVGLLKRAGAKEVHIRVASPPLRYPCFMGINIPTHDELIANRLDLQQLAEYIGADSVVYLSLEGLVKAVRGGAGDTPVESSDHVTTQSSDGVEFNGSSDEFSADAVCNSSVTTLSQIDSDGCVAARKNGYCVACLNGSYPVALDW